MRSTLDTAQAEEMVFVAYLRPSVRKSARSVGLRSQRWYRCTANEETKLELSCDHGRRFWVEADLACQVEVERLKPDKGPNSTGSPPFNEELW